MAKIVSELPVKRSAGDAGRFKELYRQYVEHIKSISRYTVPNIDGFIVWLEEVYKDQPKSLWCEIDQDNHFITDRDLIYIMLKHSCPNCSYTCTGCAEKGQNYEQRRSS